MRKEELPQGEYPEYYGEKAEERRKISNIFLELFKKVGYREYENRLFLPIKDREYSGYASLKESMFIGKFKNKNYILTPEVTYRSVKNFITKNSSFEQYVYVSKCYRYERSQFLRSREFTQLGFEILSYTRIEKEYIIQAFKKLLEFYDKIGLEKVFIEINVQNQDSNKLDDYAFLKILGDRLVIKSISRGPGYYFGLVFESAIEKNRRIQITGGGFYEVILGDKKIYGFGAGIGLERISYFAKIENLEEELYIFFVKNIEKPLGIFEKKPKVRVTISPKEPSEELVKSILSSYKKRVAIVKNSKEVLILRSTGEKDKCTIEEFYSNYFH